nr:MAG TPA: anaerobic ribonucleoside triphosphate reductase [Caudoviricetes sp.]
MVTKVKKRDGRIVDYDSSKIVKAIAKAGFVDKATAQRIANEISNIKQEIISIEEIQDCVEKKLMATTYKDVAKEYVRYRYKRELIRNSEKTNNSVLEILDLKNQDINAENSNKNPVILSTQRDYMAGEVSKELTMRLLLSSDIVEAHKEGIIHFHDADYFAQKGFNCCLINLEDMLQNGTVINGTLIEKPHSFATACNIATQIMAQIASNQYGGQSESLSHLAPFVDVSRQRLRKEVREEYESLVISSVLDTMPTEDIINKIAERRLKDEIKRGVQTMQYQINTLMTSNGQTPFVTIWMYLGEVPEGRLRDDLAMVIEEVVKQRALGTKNEQGVYVTPAFPKLVYVLEEDNITEGSKYWWLTKLCAKCSAKRLVPDYVSEKKMLELKKDKNGEGHCYPPMGCRSFLTPYITDDGLPKYYGRFNCGVVTLNLVDVALSANKNFETFWEILEERLELCHKALQFRHQHLRGTPSDVSPIHWQHGAIARLQKGETIDSLLYGGYCTISLGYAGLYECVLAMTGKSHTDKEAKDFALSVMQKLNDKCKEWKAVESIDYSVYGTPIESTTYKFATCLKKRFGIIEGVTDHDYITNSYHVCVREPIDAFAKLKFESEFQELSPGGMISYIETANLTHNIDAVLSVLKYIYDNIMYAELNTKSDYCQVCGFDGEIAIVNDGDKLVWECPNCGNRDQKKMNVARRTCGLEI